ncbi:Trypsin family serine protease, partial [human gut metagenome]
TTGIISALNRPVTTMNRSNSRDLLGSRDSSSGVVVTNAIQTSAAINPGNSGGALVNANGELIGINSSIASLSSSNSEQSGNIGIGFAIPSNLAKWIADQIIDTGKATHAFLGISVR